MRRRELLAGGLAVAALGRTVPAAAADRDVLARLLDLEQQLVLVYGTMPAERGVPVHEFRDQCREHVKGLTTALRNRGGRLPAPKARAGLATPQLAIRVEERALAAYSDAAASFGDETLLPALAAAMGNHGQHLVVLRQSLGRDPIPAAFPG
jgi:hypothetical protein